MAYSTLQELVTRYGASVVEQASQAAHEESSEGIDEGAVTAAIETMDAIIDRELSPTWGGQLPFADGAIPTDIKKISQEGAMLVLQERRDPAAAYSSPRWTELMETLQRYGKGELTFPGYSLPTYRLAKSSVNDGRVPEARWSHYDDDNKRIEGARVRTRLDRW